MENLDESIEVLTEQPKQFGEFFWKKVEEDLKIYVLQKKRPAKILKLYPIEEEDMTLNLQKIKRWSVDNEKLYRDIQENGFADFICNEENLVEHYKDLYLAQRKIYSLDKELLRFKNLEVLHLSENLIEKLENVPLNLKQLYLFNNNLSIISSKLKAPNLIFLGLGHNHLKDGQLNVISQSCPSLVGLDLCYNELSEIDVTVDNLVNLKNLRMLSLYGNPFCLLENYRKAMLNEFQMLHYFDEVRVYDDNFDQDGNPIPKEENKNSLTNNQLTTDEQNDSVNDYQQNKGNGGPIQVFELKENPKNNLYQFHLNVSVLTLDFPSTNPIIIEKTQANEEAYEKDPCQFQTCFWIEFEIQQQKYSSFNQKVKAEDIFKDQEEKTRIDFKIEKEFLLEVSKETRDFFFQGFNVTVFQQQPQMNKNPEDENPKPVLDEKGMPVIEIITLGVCKINLNDWLINTNAPRIIQSKYTLFNPEVLKVPEFHYPNKDENISLEIHKNKVEEMLKAREEALKSAVPETDPNKKDSKKNAKDKKKDEKKNTAKAGKKGKDVLEIDEKNIPFIEWSSNNRNAVFVSPNQIYLSHKDILLAVQVQIQ